MDLNFSFYLYDYDYLNVVKFTYILVYFTIYLTMLI